MREAADRGAEARQPAPDGGILPAEVGAGESGEVAAAEQGELLAEEAATETVRSYNAGGNKNRVKMA